MPLCRALQEIGSQLIQYVPMTATVSMAIIVVFACVQTGHMQWITDLLKNEGSRLYNVDSEFIEFMEDMGDYYDFTHMAIWVEKEMRSATLFNKIFSFLNSERYPTTEHWAFIARGAAIINGIKRHAFFITQFNDDDFIPNDAKSNDAEGTVGVEKPKPFVALFTDSKKTAVLSIVTSPNSEVWASEKYNVVDNESDVRKFVYKDRMLVSAEFEEGEWTLMDKPMKLREMSDCIYKTPCSGRKYDVNDNNCQHFVENLWLHNINKPPNVCSDETETGHRDSINEEQGQQPEITAEKTELESRITRAKEELSSEQKAGKDTGEMIIIGKDDVNDKNHQHILKDHLLYNKHPDELGFHKILYDWINEEQDQQSEITAESEKTKQESKKTRVKEELRSEQKAGKVTEEVIIIEKQVKDSIDEEPGRQSEITAEKTTLEPEKTRVKEEIGSDQKTGKDKEKMIIDKLEKQVKVTNERYAAQNEERKGDATGKQGKEVKEKAGSQMMTGLRETGLRKRIEERIGKQILENYCHETDDQTSGPTMFPPIPDSKFIDKLPEEFVLEGVNAFEKELQDAYAAEVKLYRCFEELKGNYIVCHQLQYTHEQYSAFLPLHQCNRKVCRKGPEVHLCHREHRQLDGECDFVVIGYNFVALFEVKSLSFQLDTECGNSRLEACYDSARTQMKGIIGLIKSINPIVMIYEFTVFPTISQQEVDERYLCDETILFNDDLENLALIINCCETLPDWENVTDQLRCCILGLWCIRQDNKWDLTVCSLSRCIMDTDDKLSRALITRRSVDHDETRKRKERAHKMYPKNPIIFEAPYLFKNYLNISCLTRNQLDVFNSNERFLWIEGPAGSGKTTAMLGKIISLALSTPPEKRILLMCVGDHHRPAVRRHQTLLDNIREDITCDLITYNYSDINDKLENARSLLAQQLSDSSSKIVLLSIMENASAEFIDSLITLFDYVFVNDFQHFVNTTLFVMSYLKETWCADKNIISEGLLPVVKNSSSNGTSMWIFSDDVQSWNNAYALNHELLSFIAVTDELRSYFENSEELTVCIRNTFEIATLVSIIREHYMNMDIFGRAKSVTWPRQETGHILHGIKPAIYLLRDDEPATWTDILNKELDKLRGSDSFLQNKDIAVLHNAHSYHRKHTVDTVNSVVERWSTTEDKITVHPTEYCMSADWPSVIFICRYETYSTTVTLPDNSEKEITYSDTILELYQVISTARVYSTVILINYTPNTCQYTDRLLEELRQCRDVCRIVDLE